MVLVETMFAVCLNILNQSHREMLFSSYVNVSPSDGFSVVVDIHQSLKKVS